MVEADLRRPKAAEYLKLEGAVGVTTILTGRVDIDEALQPAPWGLKVIAAGSIPPNPAELLQSTAMKMLIKEPARAFRHRPHRCPAVAAGHRRGDPRG